MSAPSQWRTPGDEVERLEKDGVGTVLPRSLEAEPQATIEVRLQSVQRERRPCDVPAEPLQAFSVATVDHDLGVDVYPSHLGEQTSPLGAGDRADRQDELGGLAPCFFAEKLDVRGGSPAQDARTGCSGASVSGVSPAPSKVRPCRASTRSRPSWVHAATWATSAPVGAPSS